MKRSSTPRWRWSPSHVVASGRCPVACWRRRIVPSLGPPQLPKLREELRRRIAAEHPYFDDTSLLTREIQLLARILAADDSKPKRTSQAWRLGLNFLRAEQREMALISHELDRAKVRRQGKAEGRADLVRRQLTAKFGALPLEALQRLEQASEAEVLEWSEGLLFAQTLEAVFKASSR